MTKKFKLTSVACSNCAGFKLSFIGIGEGFILLRCEACGLTLTVDDNIKPSTESEVKKIPSGFG